MFISTSTAAKKAQVCIHTVRYWCQKYGIGHKVGGRYRVDRERLEALLSGNMI